MSIVSENTVKVLEKIENAAQKVGKTADDITLIGVTKTVDTDRINESIEAGIDNIGENYVNELCEKYENLKKSKINIHFIGHLQRNKVKYIVDKVDLIQSVDSLRLGEEIDKQCAIIGRIMNVLVEINIGGEETKSGVDKQKAFELVMQLDNLEHINVCGLMCIPPKLGDREYFLQMKQLFDEISATKKLDILSMGMSDDFECAIECGANMVRVGTALYGQRNYNK